MNIDTLQQYAQTRIVRTPVHHRAMLVAALAASAALFLFSGPSFAQNAAKQQPMTGRTSSASAVREGVAPVAPAVVHAPAVAYLLLESAQGPLNGDSTDAMHRNWIAVSAIDKGSLADGAAKGQASDAMDHKNISDGAAKGQASDATAPGFPALDASSKDAAKMASGSGSHSGSFTVQKEIDKASPLLARAAASGSYFSSAQLDVLDGGVWHHYHLSDVMVSSVQPAGGGNRPSEEIHFTFRKIEME